MLSSIPIDVNYCYIFLLPHMQAMRLNLLFRFVPVYNLSSLGAYVYFCKALLFVPHQLNEMHEIFNFDTL